MRFPVGQTMAEILDRTDPWRKRSLASVALHPEAVVNAENWHEERDRLTMLLKAIESGKITHIDENDLRQLQAANPENVALLKERLAKLNARLGDTKF